MKKFCALFALASFVCLAPWLAAQDVTVMPPALFDSPASDISNRPDTPPALSKPWSPVFPDKLRAATDPDYVILTQSLDKNGKRSSWELKGLNTVNYEKSLGDGISDLRCAPAQKNGKPIASQSWLGVIYNPAGASENAPDATPRLLKVAPVFVTLKQWLAFPAGPRVVRGSIEIDTAGAAKNLKLESNASYAKAVRPAIERGLAQWQFAPARKGGQPVASSLRLGFVLRVAPNPKDGNKIPEVIKQPRPIYPAVMRSNGMVGNVTLNFIVDEDGCAREPAVVRSNNPNFEQPALDGILRWTFKPGITNGMPVKTRMQIPISFSLLDNADSDPDDDVKTAYNTTQPTKKQIAEMPEGLRYDVAPEARNVIYPVYPYEMLRDGKEGEATVAVFVASHDIEQIAYSVDDGKFVAGKRSVSTNGVVEQIAITKETAPEFGQAALAACEYFEFAPAQLKGKPTDAIASVRQKFDSGSPFVTDEDRAMLRLEKKSPQKIIAAAKLDAMPKRIISRKPPFPLAALQENITKGEAVVEFLIDTEGKVRLPRIVSATHPSFGYMAVQTVANWRYEPPKAQGKPVVTRARVPFQFTSNARDAEDDAPAS